MPSVTNAITISRPIGDVFAVLTNVENTGKWFPGNVEEHWTSPPPHGVGSTRRAVVTTLKIAMMPARLRPTRLAFRTHLEGWSTVIVDMDQVPPIAPGQGARY